MNVLKTFVDLNAMPLGSYDVLIGMDWLDHTMPYWIVIIKLILVWMKREIE